MPQNNTHAQTEEKHYKYKYNFRPYKTLADVLMKGSSKFGHHKVSVKKLSTPVTFPQS